MTDESALVVAPLKKARKAAKKKEYNCDTCKLSGVKIPTIGTLETAEILIVAEPPSPAEFKFSKPLAGRAYRLMTNSLARTGFDLTKCYFTNVLLCQLPPRKDPTPTQIKSCGVNLVDKIKQMPNLKMVITCGKWPLKFFLNKSNPRAVRGELFTKNDLNVFPIYDPYYILDNIHEREVMETDLARAKTIIDKGIKKKEIHYRLAKTLDDLREFKEILVKAKKLSFDIESRGGEYGLDLYTDKNCITTIAFTNEKMENFCIPVDHPESALLKHRDIVIETIRAIMAAPSKKIAHNLKFDAKGLKLLIDVDTVNPYFDTALANSVLSKGNGDSNKLKRLAIEHLGYVNDYGIIKDDAPLDEEPLLLVAEYNAEDTENTMLLYELFKPRLKEEDLHDYFTNLMMKGCEGLTDVEMNGIKIDLPYGEKLSEKYATICTDLEAELRAYPEVQAMTAEADELFNLESPKQLAVLLFDKFKLPVIKETKTGRSTDVDTMKALEDKHPFIAQLQAYKKATKLVSTYLTNLTVKHLKDDGKIHCNFNQDVTRTGRLSANSPNLQNQPSKGQIGKDLKKIFISSFEGGSLIQADYSQIELRVAAIVANEKNMLKIYADDGDIHRSMAAFITGKSEADVTDAERTNAKPVNFGFLYGQSPKGFVVSAKRDYGVDFTLAEATRIRERYFKMYPALVPWYEHTWAFARKTSYVKTLFGRKRTIFNLHSTNNFLKQRAENQSINTEVQGSAGEMCILAIYHINKYLKGKGMRSMIVNTVHDSIILDCPKEEVMQTAKIVKTIMENVPTPFDKPIPMKADIEIGPSWGALKEVTM